MEIVSIFGKNLFAFKYSGEAKDEFARLFELWHDPEYLEDFFETNISDLQNGFWGNMSVEDAIIETYNNAQTFEKRLIDLSKQSEKEQVCGLEEIFRSLDNSNFQIFILGKSKAKSTWLRIYALRIDKNIYLITGGTIKLTLKMQDRAHTTAELRKLENCRNFLLEQGIVDIDGIIEETES